MLDSQKRTTVKTISWRVAAVTTMAVITLLLTGSWKEATVLTIAYQVSAVVLYFLHERVWNGVKWGKTTGLFIQMTGWSGAGKTTIAKGVAKKLSKRGLRVEIIDGDEYRENLCKDLGFSKEDRNTNIKRLGFVGKVFARNDVVCIMAAINPYETIRKELKEDDKKVKTVYVKCNKRELINRDTKGLYRRALLPETDPDHIDNFTGISDPFEEPTNPDLIINTDIESVEQSVERLYKFIIRNIG